MTKTPPDAPPPVLDMARVLAYAVLDDSVQWTRRQNLFVGDKELGAVPRLALCQNVGGELRCSFCGRGLSAVRNLVEGQSGTHICNHCIDEFYATVRQPPEENPR